MKQNNTSKLITKNEPNMANTISFSAIKGMQAGKNFYIAMCTMKSIAKLFTFDDAGIPPNLRSQRTLRKSRIPRIKNYILENNSDYIFSSIAVSVDGKINFKPFDDATDLGHITMPQDVTILINDGQHRVAAIKSAVEEMPEIGGDKISVVFFEDVGLEKCQQMFADLNKHAVKPTKSLGILYDRRSDFSVFIVNMVKTVPVFKNRTELEKNTLSNRTTKFFTLSGITTATTYLLGKSKHLSKLDKDNTIKFWNIVSKNIPEWLLLMDNKIPAYEIREGSVHANTNMLQAIAVTGNVLMKEFPKSWDIKLNGFRKIDWNRSNPDWDGKIIIKGRMIKNKIGINMAANVLLSHCGAKNRVDESSK